MSFILDALKKSENERQRQVGPSLADARIARRRDEKPWWAVAVAALLVINLGVLLVVLLRGGGANTASRGTWDSTMAAAAAGSARNGDTRAQADDPARAAEPRMPAANGTWTGAAGGQLPGQGPGTPSPAVRPLADVADPYAAAAGMPNPHLAAAAAVPEGPAVVRQIEAPSVAPAAGGAGFQAQTAGGSGPLPRMSDVIANGTALPDMHLDIHVYSGDPAERFVFVNMRKYIEGQALREGPRVERITPDGVVLDYNGTRFLLPRP